MLFVGLAASGNSQNPSQDLKTKVDAVISTAYQSAAVKFPCKLKPHGKAKILGWRDVEKCLNSANDRVDWEELSQRLVKIREDGRFWAIDISSAVESSLAAHAIPYDKVFLVKEMKALLPLSNSLLKFLPADSLMNLPVYDQTGAKIGTFVGVYSYDREGGLAAANRYRMSIFQYTDLKGNMQAPTDKLLFDTYGVPWKDAMSQPGFRLPADKLLPKH